MTIPDFVAPGVTRRRFLRSTATGAAAAAFPAVLRAARPNGNVQIAVVGVSARGYGDLHSTADHPGTPHFSDYRVMLEQLGDSVDAVIVATPDHMHAPVAVAAMQRGKHVFCQKPLAHTVWECRQMRRWAEKKGLITQMGNQIHSAVEYRLATRLLREGVIGKVKEVHSWVAVGGNERTCWSRRPVRNRCRPGSTGISGLAPRRSGRMPPAFIILSPGVTGRISEAVPLATSVATSSIRSSPALVSRRPCRSWPRTAA